MQVPVQKLAGYPQKHPIFEGGGPQNGPVPAVGKAEESPSVGGVPKNVPPPSKTAIFAGGVPNNGTPPTVRSSKAGKSMKRRDLEA